MTAKDLIRSAFLLFFVPAVAMAIEEPEYKVVAQYADFEVRLYAPYIVAEVDVQGDFENAGNEAFRILAGYIFGDNAASEKMSMTAPVAATTAAAADRTTYAFVMERKHSLQSLPVPNDDSIRIRQLPEMTMAVNRYSGRWTEENYQQHAEALLASLDAHGLRTIGHPILARYNSPFSLPFMRRNEVMLEIMSGSSKDEVAAQ